LVEDREPDRLVRRAEVAPVPVDDDLQAVRVHYRHVEDDDLVANPAQLRLLARDHPVGEIRRKLGAGHFSGVDTGVDPDDGFPLTGERACLRVCQIGSLGQPPRDLPVPVQGPHVRLARDDRQKKRASLRRFADLLDANAIGRGIQGFEVRLDLPVVGELVVCPGLPSDHRFRRRYLGVDRTGHADDQARTGQQDRQPERQSRLHRTPSLVD
jgi:hypothetical protein